MKIRFFHCAAFMATICATTLSAYERGVEHPRRQEIILLASPRLAIEIMPESAGRISSIKLPAPYGELLAPSRVSEIEETPLFRYPKDNMNGIFELFWENRINGSNPMRVVAQTQNSLTMECRFYGNILLDLTRQITLVPDALEIRVQSTFTNRSGKVWKLRPWIHLVGTAPSSPQIPQQPGTHRRPGFGIVGNAPAPKLFTFNKNNNFLPPGANWLGVKLNGKKIVWALTLPEKTLQNDGIFYSWGDGNRGGIQTSEVIWPEFQLPNDGSATINYSILIFPGLEQLNGIIGKTGIEIKDGKLTASFAADEAERIITFFYKTADGSENSATVKLPSGKAGSIQVLSVPWNDRIIEAAWQIGQSPKQPLFLP
ncbi:MAG: hypothetical protein E7053_09015 [Lentisphaerae bacterium]|nr:hypothetical protein [Lentisphaerota bacterium]